MIFMSDKSVELTAVAEWIGKTKAEVGLEPTGESKINVTFGNFKGKGTVFTNFQNQLIESVFVTMEKSGVKDFYGKLEELYGGPVSEIMVPYAPSNGGARRGFVFDAGKAVISISEGSTTNFVSVDIKKNTNPGKKEDLILRKSPEEDYSQRRSVLMKVLDYSNGVVTAKVWNQKGETAEFLEKPELFIKAKDREGYYGMRPMTAGMIIANAGRKHSLADGESVEITLDMRKYGKVEPGKYMLISDNVRGEFELIQANQDTGEAATSPWFCPECGTKNEGKFCTECGHKKA